MFGWLQDLIDGISNAISQAFSGIGQQISSTIWGTMLTWFYDTIYGACADFFSMMGGMGAEIFGWLRPMDETGCGSMPHRIHADNAPISRFAHIPDSYAVRTRHHVGGKRSASNRTAIRHGYPTVPRHQQSGTSSERCIPCKNAKPQ